METNTKPTSRKAKNQGMNWIRPVKRLAIYLRDGLACAYCGASVETGAQLTLDHITPYSAGGTNEATNLVTCCHRCNSSRGNRSWRKFAGSVAEYINHGATAATIIAHISRTTKRVLPMEQAENLMAQRGGFSAALKG